jgi:phage terminase large subunit
MGNVVIPYKPREQSMAYHNRAERWACTVAHRRFGKTVREINELIKKAVTCELPNPRFAYIAPYYNQAKNVAWDYLKHYSRAIQSKSPSETELTVELINGARIRIYGADNPDALRGIYLDGVVLDEYGDMRPNVFGEIIRPLLTDRKGWASFIGTPKGKNHFYRVAKQAQESPDWFYQTLKASETGILPQSELDDARRQMTPEQYAQEFECAFDVPALGAIYGDEMAKAYSDKRITSVPVDGAGLVHTAWDLGVGDATCIWFFQIIGRGVHLIDYYQDSGKDITHYLGVLNARGYRYGQHFVPHDAEARERWSANTMVQVAESQGVRLAVLPREGIEQGINAVRMMFSRCWFDEAKCADGIDGLMNYRREYAEKRGEFKPTPLHDWASHPADAFRYLAMALDRVNSVKPITFDTNSFESEWA